jgi:DNA polymerase-3 subunit alpha
MNFNPIYWNTACLIVNSGATDEEAGASTDYGKIAKAIGDIRQAGINVSLADINNSMFGFTPDVANNRIIFGLKGLLNVGDDVVAATIENRPYISPRDYLNKVKPGKQAMISLIKGGAFDSMMDRKMCMAWYIWETCDKKKRITLQNMSGLIKHGILPEKTEEQIMARRIFEFNRYLKAVCKSKNLKFKDYYILDERACNFLTELDFTDELSTIMEVKEPVLSIKIWDNYYQRWMDIFRNWIASDKEGILNSLNDKIFLEDWNKYASGNLSSWEMEALCFYYHDHELINVNQNKYGFVDFFSLPEDPIIDRTFIKTGKEINIYKLYKICGTCIAKNKTKSTVTLLTTTGVVEVKFRKGQFAFFDKQISARNDEGIKKVLEKSWFNRGNIIVAMGIRSGDAFIVKKYNSTSGHSLYKVDEIKNDGTLSLTSERILGGNEED